MKTYVNPPFSKISFLLFHEGTADAEIGPDLLPASARDLAQATERLGKWPDPPSGSEQSTLVFHEYAESLRVDATRLVEALQQPSTDEAVKVFDSIRKKCDSCHHFFRYDETANVEKHLKLAGGEVMR